MCCRRRAPHLKLAHPGADCAAAAYSVLHRWSIIWRLVSPLIHPDTRKLMALYSAKARKGEFNGLLLGGRGVGGPSFSS